MGAEATAAVPAPAPSPVGGGAVTSPTQPRRFAGVDGGALVQMLGGAPQR